MKYQVMPDLTPIEYEALKADIAQRGVLVAVEMDEAGELLDGHHRVRAWNELRAEGVDVPEYPRMVRKGMSEEQKRNHARSLNVLRRQLTREQRADVMRAMRADGATYQEIAAAVGVSHPTAMAATRDVIVNPYIENSRGQVRPASYEKRADPRRYAWEFGISESTYTPGAAVVLDPVAAVAQVREADTERREQKRADRMADYQAKAEAPALPDTKYRIIYCDPPWKYDDTGVTTSPSYGGTKWHYPSMTVEELCALPVGAMADADSVLFMWATSPKLPEALRIIEAWGFDYKTSFVWDKVKHNFGYYNSVRHEFLLIAGRGRSTPDTKTLYDSVQTIERTEHSVKPEEFRAIIDDLYPVGRRIELFARREAAGWERWGNE